MDSLQFTELQSFLNAANNNNKGEPPSTKISVDSIDVGVFECSGFDQFLAAGVIDVDELTQSYDNRRYSKSINISTPHYSSDFSEYQSLPQVVLGATAVVQQGNNPIECSSIPTPVVNFLDPSQSPDDVSDITSYYSDDSSNQHMPEFSQLTSPGPNTPSTSNFHYPHVNSQNIKHEDFEMPQCQASQYGTTSETASLPFVTSPTSSVPSPTSTIYSVSSPGTPGPSTSQRGRRPHNSASPYSSKTPRRRQVEKGTEEYVEKRARNNVAVRKSRAKAKAKQRDTEGRVKQLQNHNDQLQKKVDLLSKELTVLKGLFMNVGASIPDDFLSLLEDS